MHSFVVRPAVWPAFRAFSRNPLVRTADRIDSAVMALAILLVVVAAGCAGVFGSIVHDVKAQKYLEEAKTRHTVVATAVADSAPWVTPALTAPRVRAQWQLNGVEHTGFFLWDQSVKAGSALQIWVDTAGNRVDEPTPITLAGPQAILAAALAWWTAVVIIVSAVSLLRAHTAQMRDDLWETGDSLPCRK